MLQLIGFVVALITSMLFTPLPLSGGQVGISGGGPVGAPRPGTTPNPGPTANPHVSQ
jgi:hypothetical protein